MEGAQKKKKQLNLYYLLGIDKNADQAQIKSAYKKLALKWHPDKNGGSEEATEMFKSISEAYSVLSNPERRKRYDLFGEIGNEGDDDLFGNMDDFMFGAEGEAFEEFIKILEKDNVKSFS